MVPLGAIGSVFSRILSPFVSGVPAIFSSGTWVIESGAVVRQPLAESGYFRQVEVVRRRHEVVRPFAPDYHVGDRHQAASADITCDQGPAAERYGLALLRGHQDADRIVQQGSTAVAA